MHAEPEGPKRQGRGARGPNHKREFFIDPQSQLNRAYSFGALGQGDHLWNGHTRESSQVAWYLLGPS